MIRRVFRSTIFPYHNFHFSAKKQNRLEKKLEIEAAFKQSQTLESVVDQNDYTQDQLQQFAQNRVTLMKQLSDETKLPFKAVLAASLLALPLISLTGGLYFMIQNGIYLKYAPYVFTAGLKYSGITICFLSGIHWGVGMSLHEQQLDSQHSSMKARVQFFFASIIILLAMLTINQIGYDKKFIDRGILSFGVMSLDTYWQQKAQLPRWFLKMKYPFTLSYLLCLYGLSQLSSYDEVTNRNDIFRRQVQSKEQLLRKE